MKPANSVLSGYGTTIFEVMSRLAREHDAINLGQGFPDTPGPDDVRDTAARALVDYSNQYPSMLGIPELRRAVAAHNHRFYGVDVDWEREVMVTSGATEALAVCLLGLLNPGDEVVVFEPTYDSYRPVIELCGAVPRAVRLSPPDWSIDRDALAAAFSPKTKLLLLNSPMNPTGKVFSREELEHIASLCCEQDAYAVCDEVYEHLVFDGWEHIPLLTLPGMRERTARIGSAGKTFSFTGWKVGYITAAPELIGAIGRAHQYMNFTTPPNLQRAVAYGLEKDESYFRELAADMQKRRDLLCRGLESIGFGVASCHGTYFVGADLGALGIDELDADYCQRMTVEARVAAVPYSAFYAEAGGIRSWLRFAFCKQPEVLEQAIERLRRFTAAGAAPGR